MLIHNDFNLSTSEQERFRYETKQTKRKEFPILDKCFLALNLLNTVHVSYLAFGFRKIAQERREWTDAATALCSRENKIFFLVPKNKTIELKHQHYIRLCEPKSFLYLFSQIALIQNARQPDGIDSCFSLFIVHSVHVKRV